MPQKRRTGSTRGSKKQGQRSATKRAATKTAERAGAAERGAAKKSGTTAKRGVVKKRGTAAKRGVAKKRGTAAKRGVAKKRGTAAERGVARKRSTTKRGTAAKRGAARRGSAAGNTASGTTTSRRRTLPYEIRRSTIQGKGAFATRDIRRGERIGEYRGERISWEEADRRYDDESQERHHTFLFEVDDETVIDAGVRGSGVKYINHSCDPNCEALIEDGRVFIEAIRPIRKGQELFYDYSYVLDEPHTPAVKKRYPCWCGAKNCRGTILAKKR